MKNFFKKIIIRFRTKNVSLVQIVYQENHLDTKVKYYKFETKLYPKEYKLLKHFYSEISDLGFDNCVVYKNELPYSITLTPNKKSDKRLLMISVL